MRHDKCDGTKTWISSDKNSNDAIVIWLGNMYEKMHLSIGSFFCWESICSLPAVSLLGYIARSSLGGWWWWTSRMVSSILHHTAPLNWTESNTVDPLLLLLKNCLPQTTLPHYQVFRHLTFPFIIRKQRHLSSCAQ